MHGDEENAQECNDEADDDVSSSDEDVPLNLKHATQRADADAEDSNSSEDKADIENDKDADMETYKDVDDSALPDDVDHGVHDDGTDADGAGDCEDGDTGDGEADGTSAPMQGVQAGVNAHPPATSNTLRLGIATSPRTNSKDTARPAPARPAQRRVADDDDDFQSYHPLLKNRPPVPSAGHAGRMKKAGKKKSRDNDKESDDSDGAEGSDGAQGGASNQRPKDAYDKVMSLFTPHLDVAFDASSIGRCTAIVMMQKIKSYVVNGDCPPVMMYKLIRDQMFARQQHQKKEVWKTPLGVQASNLKRRIMFCVMSMARKNLFRPFAVMKRPMAHPPMFSRKGTPVLPTWVTKKVSGKYYVNFKHIKDAMTRNEECVDPKAEFARRCEVALRAYPSRLEVGQYVCDKLFHAILQSRTPSRRLVRNLFFFILGYLFINWKDYPDCPVHDSEVVMKWAAPMGAPRQVLLKDNTKPSCETYARLYEDTEEMNGEKFHEVVRSMDDVTLVVRHDVLVRKDMVRNNFRKRLGNTRRTWTHAINLMEVMLVLVHGMVGLSGEEDALHLLSASKDSIEILYLMARALRVLLTEHPVRNIMEMSEEEAKARKKGNNDMDADMDPTDADMDAVEAEDMDVDAIPAPDAATGAATTDEAAGSPADVVAGSAAEDPVGSAGAASQPTSRTRLTDEEVEDLTVKEMTAKDCVTKMFDLLMPDKRNVSKRLTHATCTIEEGTYKGEHIGENNDFTVRYGGVLVDEDGAATTAAAEQGDVDPAVLLDEDADNFDME